MCQYVSRSGKCPSLISYLCIVNWVRRLRSVLVRCSIDLRSFSVPPSFILRSSFVRTSLQKRRNIGETTNLREIRIHSTFGIKHLTIMNLIRELNLRKCRNLPIVGADPCVRPMSERHISTDLASVVRLSALGRHMGLPLQAAV